MVEFSNGDANKINIGLILERGSWEGKLVESCIMMAIEDFYNLQSRYETRIALQVRDSKGDSLQPVAAALDLLENVQVHAIIIPKISDKDSFLATLGDKANVPILSFSSISSVDEHPYFLQVAEDETIQCHGIAALTKVFKWTSCAILYEDSDGTRGVQSYLYNILQENQMDVIHQAAISLRSTDGQIINKLHKILKMRTSIIIVHMPPSLASQVLVTAKKLGMMRKGFAWIITSRTMNFLGSLSSSVYESMEGVLGFKPYIPTSSKLQNFTLKWRREFQLFESNIGSREFNVFGLWAYDAVWALAEAIERAGIKPSESHVQANPFDLTRLWVSASGPALLSKIVSSKFVGLAGDFQLKSRKLVHETYKILNVIGNGERRVGFWSLAPGLSKDMHLPIGNTLETIIWPGFSMTAPQSWLAQMSGNVFKVGIPHGRTPELLSTHHDPQTNRTIFDGFCVDVFRAAIDRLPHDISFDLIPFYNGSYWNLIYEVHLQTYDVAVGDITILANRSEYVDFSLPYTESGPAILAKLDDDKDPWFFLKPFDPYLWIIATCLFVVTGSVVWLIEHPINEEFQGSPAWQIGTILWFAISTLVYAHREKLQSNLSRFVVGVWLFVVLILTSSYTANLSSTLTVEQLKLTKGDYIGSASTLARGLTVNNLNFGDNRLRLYHSREDYVEALKTGSKNGGVGAIIDEIPYIKIFLAKYPRGYTMIQSSMTTSGFGFAFPKGSPLVHDISRAIAELREEGELAAMEKKWLRYPSPLSSQDTQQFKPNVLTSDSFFGLFIISGISKFLVVLVLLAFLLHERLSKIYLIFRALEGETLTFMLRYLYPRNRIGRFFIRQ